jgi:hypothetical protein
MSDLTDRMRTCAAYIMSRPNDALMPTEHLLDDAADLLIAASNALETAPQDLGEPMAIIPPQPTPRQADATSQLTAASNLFGTLPDHPRACPKCGSHEANTVHREGPRLMLHCPACGERWQFKPQARWT